MPKVRVVLKSYLQEWPENKTGWYSVLEACLSISAVF